MAWSRTLFKYTCKLLQIRKKRKGLAKFDLAQCRISPRYSEILENLTEHTKSPYKYPRLMCVLLRRVVVSRRNKVC